jgi:hypothetical protein
MVKRLRLLMTSAFKKAEPRYIHGVSEEIVNILGGGIMDYFE